MIRGSAHSFVRDGFSRDACISTRLRSAGIKPVLSWLASNSRSLRSNPPLIELFPPEMTGRLNTASNVLMFTFSFLFQWGIGAVLRNFPVIDGRFAAEGYTIAFAALALAQAAVLVWLLPMRDPFRAAP